MANMLPLHVRDRDGVMYGVAVDGEATVEEIFTELEKEVSTKSCNLSFQGRVLGRDDEISETGLGCDDVLDLTPKPINTTWELFEGDITEAAFQENNTVIINKNSGTKNWDAHTAPVLPLAPQGTTYSYVAQCLYDPSWTTSIGVTAEGIRAGRGSEEMAQVSIGEKGAVAWDNEQLKEYTLKYGSILEFAVESYPYSPKDAKCQVNVNVYVHIDGERVLGKTGSFLTESKKIMLSCYCYAPAQGWRIFND